MTPQDELTLRRKQLEARTNQYGYGLNVAAIKQRIAELEAQVNG